MNAPFAMLNADSKPVVPLKQVPVPEKLPAIRSSETEVSVTEPVVRMQS